MYYAGTIIKLLVEAKKSKKATNAMWFVSIFGNVRHLSKQRFFNSDSEHLPFWYRFKLT